jgi:hypothetical protein
MVSPRATFWFTTHILNPAMRGVLGSPLGKKPGRRLAVIKLKGKKSGEVHRFVALYCREGDTAWAVPAHPELKQWWRNLRPAAPVALRLAGTNYRATGEAIRGADEPERVAGLLQKYLIALPKPAGALGLEGYKGEALDPASPPVRDAIVVEFRLRANGDAESATESPVASPS